jgi:hypothetical protein
MLIWQTAHLWNEGGTLPREKYKKRELLRYSPAVVFLENCNIYCIQSRVVETLLFKRRLAEAALLIQHVYSSEPRGAAASLKTNIFIYENGRPQGWRPGLAFRPVGSLTRRQG